MRITKEDIPVKFDVPGATARQLPDFGDATGFGTIGGEYFSLGAGTDIAPLLTGLEHDACQAPHWGYMISGHAGRGLHRRIRRTPAPGGDLLLAAGSHGTGHRRRRGRPVQPQAEHTHVLDHMMVKMQG